MKYILICLGLLLAACQNSQTTPPAESKEVTWNGSMRSLKEALTAMVPYIYDSKKFTDPQNTEFLREQIQQMAYESRNLTHNQTLSHRDPTVRFVAAQFSESLGRAKYSFREGRLDYSRYELMKVVSSCVQCHSRLPQGPEFSGFFLKDSSLADLNWHQKGEYLIAVRRFDAAADVLQKGLRTESDVSNEKSAALALQLAVQYEQKPDQAMKVTEAILANPKSSEILKNKARGWQSSVKKWQQEKESPKTLDGTSKLLVNAQTEIESMRALAQILAFLSTEPQQPELGEALLLAGTAYDKLSDFLPSDLHENYYASCIRSQPKSGQAKRCYSKLEESIRFGYTGTSGENLPVEIQVWLGQLKKEADKEAGN